MTKNSIFSRARERRRQHQHSQQSFHSVGYSVVPDDCDSSEEELFNLKDISPKEQFIECPLQAGDTLQSLSLQYHCPISELKRLNNIHRENEIFARTSIRIPMKPLSSLVDMIPEPVHGEKREVNSEARLVTIGSGSDPAEFLAAMDRDLARIRAATHLTDLPLPASDILFQGLENSSTAKSSSCNGSDWGLHWQQLLICSLILTFFLPIYVWYKKNTLHSEDKEMNVTSIDT